VVAGFVDDDTSEKDDDDDDEITNGEEGNSVRAKTDKNESANAGRP